MSRLRVLLLWLVMLAVPFQGYAAASMVVCETGSSEAGTTTVAVGTDVHDHAAHQHGAAKASEKDDGAKASKAGPEPLHKCATCASCANCHAVAMTGMPVLAFHPLPQADLAEPFHAIASIPPRVLDKPPRA